MKRGCKVLDKPNGASAVANEVDFDTTAPLLHNQPVPVLVVLVPSVASPETGTGLGLFSPSHTEEECRYGVSSRYSHIPEAQGLSWYDDRFEGEGTVIAVFDTDKEMVTAFFDRRIYETGCWIALCIGFLFILSFWYDSMDGIIPILFTWWLMFLSFLVCAFKRQQCRTRDHRHLAVTTEGVIVAMGCAGSENKVVLKVIRFAQFRMGNLEIA